MLRTSVFILVLVLYVLLHITFISKYVEAQINSKWQHESSLYNEGLLERIKQNEHKLNENLQQSNEILSNAKVQVAIIKELVQKSKKHVNLVKVYSGDVTLNSEEIPNILAPDGCEAERGIKNVNIFFEQEFNQIPQVFMTLTLLDFGHGEDHRIKTEINNVTKQGFNLNFMTWCNTRMSQAKATWVAIGW